MLKPIRNGLIFTACACLASGCGDQTGQPATQQTDTPTARIQPADHSALPTWRPSVGEPIDFKAFDAGLAEQYASSPEDNPGPWAIYGNSCSWYCGGEANNVVASTFLYSDGPFSYAANNAHDLSYDTAWVEGAEGPGIGEMLTYVFSNKCPRITTILIHNGYIKNEEVWTKNNRVRTLELSINGKPTAKLALNDTPAEQAFDLTTLGVGPLGRRDDRQPLVITFKILDVYPGTTYDDTAITEIFFDGIDVH